MRNLKSIVCAALLVAFVAALAPERSHAQARPCNWTEDSSTAPWCKKEKADKLRARSEKQAADADKLKADGLKTKAEADGIKGAVDACGSAKSSYCKNLREAYADGQKLAAKQLKNSEAKSKESVNAAATAEKLDRLANAALDKRGDQYAAKAEKEEASAAKLAAAELAAQKAVDAQKKKIDGLVAAQAALDKTDTVMVTAYQQAIGDEKRFLAELKKDLKAADKAADKAPTAEKVADHKELAALLKDGVTLHTMSLNKKTDNVLEERIRDREAKVKAQEKEISQKNKISAAMDKKISDLEPDLAKHRADIAKYTADLVTLPGNRFLLGKKKNSEEQLAADLNKQKSFLANKTRADEDAKTAAAKIVELNADMAALKEKAAAKIAARIDADRKDPGQ